MARTLVSKAKDEWERGAIAASGLWEEKFSQGRSFDEWADGISESSGGRVSAAQVKGSIGGARYKKAQGEKSASDYEAGVRKTVEGRARKDDWEDNWIDSWKKAA